MKRLALLCATFALLAFQAPTSAQMLGEPVDEAAIELIKAEGLENSHVMEYMSWMTDVYGPRLTGSPELDAASDWAIESLTEIGLQNAHKDAWGPFGRGWTLLDFDVSAESPYGSFEVTAYPKAWSPGTNGPITGEVVQVTAETMAEVDALKGTLAGKIVLLQTARDIEEPFEATAQRHDDSSLLEMANSVPQASGGGGYRYRRSEGWEVRRALSNVALSEAAAVLDRGSKGDYGTIFVSSASVPADPSAGFRGPRAWNADAPNTAPQFTVAVEQYNRMLRILEKDIPLSMTVDLDVAWADDDPMEYNVIADFPGSDPEIGDEVVMLGAHFDSWHAGTGSTDNASGSAVMMEAMRILKAVYAAQGTSPRRTIRIGLWTGEEQGLLGSRGYVNAHLAESGGRGQPPTAFHPDYDRFSAYYNFDNGTGRIRGVYMQGNPAVEDIFRAWMSPFQEMGAGTLTLDNTGGTDHLAFDGVGLPGFQFIQDTIAYSTRTHHSNMDVYDHAVPEDLMQAATIVATFAYHTAERDQKLPRKPLPEPTPPVGSR